MTEDIFKDKTDEFSGGGSTSSFGKLDADRVPMIEKVFDEVLGRKPSSREIAYYKYGVIKEDGIRAKLVKSQEHKELIEKALALPGVESELKSTKVSERKLQQKLEDVNSEIIESQKLLVEKDSLIKDLRESVSNPYDFPSKVKMFEEGFDMNDKDRVLEPVIIKKNGTKELLIKLIEMIFK